MGVAMTIENVVSLNKCSITNGVAMTIENVFHTQFLVIAVSDWYN